jgi:cell division septum initiation protein DivIVA
MSDKPTIPAPPAEASLPDAVRAELDSLLVENRRQQRQIHELLDELDRIKGRHGHF